MPYLTNNFDNDCDEVYSLMNNIILSNTIFNEEDDTKRLTIEFTYRGRDMICDVDYDNEDFYLVNDLIAYKDYEEGFLVQYNFDSEYEKHIVFVVITNIVEKQYSL